MNPSPARARRGSSPLARGLLDADGPPLGDGRIIPARAGFTTGESGRSRCRPGSSPLARGLPARSMGVPHGLGIIPARAGFTESYAQSIRRIRDHPRSRGVYALCTLNEGLFVRIIPARAGFTGTTTWRSPPCGDHPRSRGVYATPRRREHPISPDHPRSRGVYHAPSSRASDFAGSSPLARGLPAEVAALTQRARIIPARAGFTTWGRGYGRASRDHPRSRGVYVFWFCVLFVRLGSSPLARGLLWRPFTHVLTWRIIPARAGFTVFVRFVFSFSWDHPRSRGVYTTYVREVSR